MEVCLLPILSGCIAACQSGGWRGWMLVLVTGEIQAIERGHVLFVVVDVLVLIIIVFYRQGSQRHEQRSRGMSVECSLAWPPRLAENARECLPLYARRSPSSSYSPSSSSSSAYSSSEYSPP